MSSLHCRSGEFRHRVSIVKPATQQDASGGNDLRRNIFVAGFWAKIESVDGSDQLAAGADTSTVTHIVTFRISTTPPKITAAHQVIFNGWLFQVRAVQNVEERGKLMTLTCIEINDSNED